MKQNDIKTLYQIGDLITELVDGLNLSVGLITDVEYDINEQVYKYKILWNDMALETEIYESIMKWRIENNVFGYYPVEV